MPAARRVNVSLPWIACATACTDPRRAHAQGALALRPGVVKRVGGLRAPDHEVLVGPKAFAPVACADLDPRGTSNASAAVPTADG